MSTAASMNIENGTKRVVKNRTSSEWIVLYGTKNLLDRKARSFTDKNKAYDFFKEKESTMHVNMYHRITEMKTTTEEIL